MANPPPNLTHRPLLSFPPTLSPLTITRRPDSQVQATAQLRRLHSRSLNVRRRIGRRDQAARFLKQTYASADIPLPTTLFKISQSIQIDFLARTSKQANKRRQKRLTPSHQISKLPIAQYAKSNVADPKLLTPCTIPPFPPRPPTSAAKLTKLSTLRCRLPSATSRRSLPHSHEKMQPLGAVAGMGGIGLRSKGRRWDSFSQAPLPVQAEKVWCRKGALITPIVGRPWTTRLIETQ